MEPERILLNWVKTPVGAQLQKDIQHHLLKLVHPRQNRYVLSLGLADSTELLKQWEAPFKWSMTETLNEPIYFDGLAHFDALPFPDDLFDSVVVAYPGFYIHNTAMLLHELERVLKQGGQLYWFDVHRWSLLGRCFKQFSQKYKFDYTFQGFNGLCRSIKHQSMSIQETDHFFFRPPTQNESLLHNLKVCEMLGPLSWIAPAGFYAICAKKINYNITPIRSTWVEPVELDEKLELIS